VSRRTDQRRDAAFVLYESEISGRPVDEVLASREAPDFTVALARSADSHRERLGGLIARNATGWELDRIAALERSIMLVALAEVAYPEAVPSDSPIPPAGAIEEAVEVAKEYCGSSAPAFVNGVLDAAFDELRQNPVDDERT
jgi:N utilization substance protein B